MDIVSILINTLGGGGGGFLGNMLKKNGLGKIGNLIAGAVGGNGLPAILGATGLLSGDSTSTIVQILTAVVGGGLGSVIGGLFKKA